MKCSQCIDAMPNKASRFGFVCLQTNFNINQRARKEQIEHCTFREANLFTVVLERSCRWLVYISNVHAQILVNTCIISIKALFMDVEYSSIHKH